MKKFAFLTLTLCLCTVLLVGCGCMNTSADVTTLPTNGELTRPTTAPSTAPSTTAATMPSSAPTQDTGSSAETGASESTGPLEGAMDDIMGGSTDDASGTSGADHGNGGNIAGRSRGTILPRN